MTKDLTIVVLTYNSSHIIRDCLGNLPFDKYEVVVVDNASSDDVVDVVQQNFPQVKIIKLEKNSGYGRGNNVALKQVNTEFALVLNPDALITQDSIEKVLSEMRANQKVAIAGPIILEQNFISQNAIDEQLNNIAKDVSGIKDMYYEKVGNGFDTRFISGACIFFRMEVLRKIGFFDEKIFMFYEDDEICLRAKRNGYKNLTVPEAVVCHVGAGSSKKTLAMIFRRNWHLKGWAKLYWKQNNKGKLSARRSSIRLTISYFVKSVFCLIKNQPEKLAENFGACCGSAAFLIGMSAFKKDGTGRA